LNPYLRAKAHSSRIFSWSGFLLAGVVQALAIAWPWNGQPLWWLQLMSLAALVWQLDALKTTDFKAKMASGVSEKTPRVHPAWRQAFWGGWIFSTAWLCGTFWWLFISLHTYGGLAAMLAAFAVFALAAALGLYYAAACACFVAFSPTRWVWRMLFFTALWTLAELVRGNWFTGFPWGAGGYAHVDGPLVIFASQVGVYGVGAIAALIAATMAQCMRLNYRRRSMLLVPLSLVLCLTAAQLGSIHVANSYPDAVKISPDPRNAGHLQVALLQGNIPQDEKFVPGGGVQTALTWYGDQLHDATASLVVTPETALPLLPSQLPPGYLQSIVTRYASGSQAAIIGLPLTDGDGYSNSVVGLRPGDAASPEALTWRYDKHHLVPFGEFVPGIFRWFTNMMNIPLGDFHRGGLAQAPFVWQGQRIAANICYEDLFGEEIGANFRDDASSPTILLNVSNIAWFGDSIAIDQHLAISRMRALEFQRPMLRATNTGATVVIDHHGRVTQSLPRLTRGVLVADVEGRYGRTLYARWVSRFGLWPLWIVALLIVASTVLLHRRRRIV